MLGAQASCPQRCEAAKDFSRFALTAGKMPALPAAHVAHSGILPCFFGGFVSRLFSNSESARINLARV
jgi:hypothetical protein